MTKRSGFHVSDVLLPIVEKHTCEIWVTGVLVWLERAWEVALAVPGLSLLSLCLWIT